MCLKNGSERVKRRIFCFDPSAMEPPQGQPEETRPGQCAQPRAWVRQAAGSHYLTLGNEDGVWEKEETAMQNANSHPGPFQIMQFVLVIFRSMFSFVPYHLSLFPALSSVTNFLHSTSRETVKLLFQLL